MRHCFSLASMSINDIPEELLLRITNETAYACTADYEFYNTDMRMRSLDGRDFVVWSEHCGLRPIASVNRQLRRICLPKLFSRICLNTTVEEKAIQAGLQRLKDCLSGRPRIAGAVT